MKYKIWKKLAIGLSAAMATSIPAVFITSCGVKPQPKPEPQPEYVETKFFNDEDVNNILKYYNKTKYLNWETGEIEDNPNCYFSAQILGRAAKLYLDPTLPNPKGVTLVEEASADTWQLKFSSEVYNVKTPHDKVGIVIRDEYGLNQVQHITIPAYDGMGKSIGNWPCPGRTVPLFPWFNVLNTEDNSYDCFGPWHLDKYGRDHYYGINEDTLCSTRIISLPKGCKRIWNGAFDIQEEMKFPDFMQDTKRPACCKAFHEYMFGTFEHPETGLWQHLVFEGDVVPIANIGKKAFFRCYSLQKDLAKYYGDYLAEQMVRYGM